MNLNIDQALFEAVNAHKSGALKEAERLYRLILIEQPEHPDANHNLGVLAVGVGKPEGALPYLKRALESNPKQGQYWLSYLNALIECSQFTEAGKVLQDGRKLGLVGEPIEQLEKRIAEQSSKAQSHPTPGKTSSLLQSPSELEINGLLSRLNAGDFGPAEKLAQDLTLKFPNHPFGWKVLGAILKLDGRAEASLEPMRHALRLAPHDAETHNNLGVTLKDLGRAAEAEASYQRAITLNPNFFEAHSNLGAALQDLGRLVEAEASCRDAIRIKPDYAEAHYNLGNVLKNLARLDQAIESYSTAIALKPDYAEAHYNLGNALRQLARPMDAVSSYRRAISLVPAFAEAHSNLGVALQDLGLPKDAAASFRETIRLKPDLAEAHYNLGEALQGLGRWMDAEESYRSAIRLKPDYVEAHNNLGVILQDVGRQAEAEASYREAIRLNPSHAGAHSNLLFSLNYNESISAEAALSEAKRYGALVSAKAKPKFTSWKIDPQKPSLRIGFVSGDLRKHPVGYFMDGLIQYLDRHQFELYAFPTTLEADDLTNHLKSNFKEWIPICGKGDLEAATAIREQGIQLLIDLSGHTAHNRLPVFSYKPAPVQISWLGYFSTTGLPEIDHFLGDPNMSPQGEQRHFTETLWNLPETWFCLTPPSQIVGNCQLPALTKSHITFGCLGNLAKMNDQVVNVWATILREIPDAVLFLKSKQLSDTKNIARTQSRFADQGIAVDRLILEGPSSKAEYFEAYGRVDIVLDTFPYPGGTTSVDALWMGVPVLTQKGSRFLSRLGESIAINAGQTNWIASDHKDYISKAIAFAGDVRGLANIRQALRDRVLQTPLFDTKRFAKHFGEALQAMWNRYNKS